jgi:tetratricopeptide (TPR) repeat protein
MRVLAARLLGNLGWVIGYCIGDHPKGLPLAERAVALLEGGPDLLELAHAQSRLAATYMRAGRWHDRLRCNQRHLEIAQAMSDVDRELTARINLGVNHHSLGDIDIALEHTRAALELAMTTGRAASRALVHNNMGVILTDAGLEPQARAHLDEGMRLAERVGYTRFLTETHGTLARLAFLAADLAAAEREARTALDLARAAGSHVDEGVALRLLAGIASERGSDETESLLASALERLAGDRYEMARTWATEAKHAARIGDHARAAARRAEAAAVFESLGARLDLERLDDPTDLR